MSEPRRRRSIARSPPFAGAGWGWRKHGRISSLLVADGGTFHPQKCGYRPIQPIPGNGPRSISLQPLATLPEPDLGSRAEKDGLPGCR